MHIATPIITLDLIKQKFSTFQLMCTYFFSFFEIVFVYFSVCTNELNVFFIFCRFSRWCWDRRYRTFMKDIKFYIVNTVKPANVVTSSKLSTVLKWSHFSCPFLENVIWIEPFLIFSLSYRWPLNARYYPIHICTKINTGVKQLISSTLFLT